MLLAQNSCGAAVDDKNMVPLQVLGVMLLAGASDMDEQTIAILILAFSFSKQATRRHGPRGPYDQAKVEGFLDLLLDQFSERMFKAFCRYEFSLDTCLGSK